MDTTEKNNPGVEVSSSHLPAPRIFDIEASKRCNVNCKFCPRESMKKVGDMKQGTFDNFMKNAPLYPTDMLSFCGLGEPLLNPLLPAYMDKLRERYPTLNVALMTNGTLLNQQTVPPLLDADINFIIVSFHGIDAPTYENLMKGARFEDTLANLGYTGNEIRKRKTNRTQLLVTFVLSKENIRDEEKIKAFWFSRGIGAVPQYMHNRGGFVNLDDMSCVDDGGLSDQSCAVFENFNFVGWNGDVLSCCHDIRHRYVMGNINNESMEVINSRKNDVVEQGNWPDICVGCTDQNRHPSAYEAMLSAFRDHPA